MNPRNQTKSITPKKIRRVYLAFEFEKDAQRRNDFIVQAHRHCIFLLEDLSLPDAIHDSRWQIEALSRIKKSDIVIILLGPDTHNAPGVLDELSLAGQCDRPVIQIMPHGGKYDLISDRVPICTYKWTLINRVLDNPRTTVNKLLAEKESTTNLD